MVDFMVIGFPGEEQAEAVRDKMLSLSGEHAINLSDALIVVKKSTGAIKLVHLFEPGRMWHLLTSAGGYPAPNWFSQLSVAWQGVEFDEKALNEIVSQIPPQGAVLFVLVKTTKLENLLEGVRGAKGVLLASSLSKSEDNSIKSALAG